MVEPAAPTNVESRARPNLVLLGLTLIPAAFLWVEVGRSVPARLEYPTLSHRDPVRLLFLCGENWRLSSAGESPAKVDQGKQRFFDATTELTREFESYRRVDPRAATARLRGVTRDITALAVVAAAWGDPAKARQYFAGGSADDAPDYARLRREEIVEGRTEREHSRSARIRRFDRSVRWLDGLMLGLVAPAAVMLQRTRARWAVREFAPVPIGLAWALVLWVWSEAASWLASVATRRDVPVLADFHPFSEFFAIPVVLALIRSALGRGAESPLHRMQRWPTTREERLEVASWTALGLAGSVAVTWGVHLAAAPLGLGPVWSQHLVESMLLGTPWEATGTVATLVIAAPFLEELLYRGLLFGGLFRRFGLGWATLVSSAVFAATHGYGIASSLSIAFHGCIYALVYARTRSLWPAMFLHAMSNVFAILGNYGLLL